MTVSFATIVPTLRLKVLPVTKTLPTNRFFVIVKSPVIVPPLFASTELFARMNAALAYDAAEFAT